jgi:AcrR family transcriptional regulator
MSDEPSITQPTQQPQPRPKRRNTKERIIDEAEKLAAIHGIEHLKLQDVADRIGIKLPSVYAHFSGREDILTAMAARINRTYSQLYHGKTGETAKETLHRGALELLEILGSKPAYFRLILRDLSVPIGYDPQNRRYSPNNSHSISQELRDLSRRTDQLLARINSDTTRKAVSGEDFIVMVHGMLLTELSWADTQPPDEENTKTINLDKSKTRLNDLLARLLN